MAQIIGQINKNRLTIKYDFITSGQVGVVKCSFSFDESWDGFMKTAVFYQNEKLVKGEVLGVETECIVPWEVLVKPEPLYIGVFGTRGSERIVSSIEKITLFLGAATEYTIPDEPTPNIYAQILDLITAYRNEYQPQVTQAVQAAIDAAKSEQHITSMTVSVETLAEGSEAAVLKTDDGTNLNLKFSIPRGVTGAKGETGAQGIQGIQGIQGEKGDTGEKGLQGVPGIQGIQGEKGDTGEKGLQGIPGGTWTSASEIPIADSENYFESKNVEYALQYLGAKTVKKYGVYFYGSVNPGVRVYDAYGCIAEVGTDSVTAYNNFDNIYPWSARRRCCGTFDANGNFIANAYKGEPGYVEDGTNGEVWVEHSLFFYKHTYNGDAEEIVISKHPLEDYLPAPIFINTDGTLRQKAYTAAYPMATVDGKATSRAGVFSDVCSLNSAMVTARTLGTNYTTQTTAEWYTECLYMWVEFATRNLQSIMNGACSIPYDATHTAVIAETGANRIIIANAKAAAYVVGQTIIIGTSLGSSNIANNRILTAIEIYDANNKALIFDGTMVNIAVGNIVCAAAYKNGTCDGVLSSSGSPVSNTDGKHNCIYRGEETPYGNAYEIISDVLFKREGAGTTESPYTYDIYFLSDPTKYNAGAVTSDYLKLNYQLPAADGYPTKLGKDSRFPFLRIPSQIGASATTYYSDYYYYPRDAVSAARVGGFWYCGASGGPCFWYCIYTPSYSCVFYRARLSYHRT